MAKNGFDGRQCKRTEIANEFVEAFGDQFSDQLGANMAVAPVSLVKIKIYFRLISFLVYREKSSAMMLSTLVFRSQTLVQENLSSNRMMQRIKIKNQDLFFPFQI